MNKTSAEFDEVIKDCKNVFMNKMHDYGTSWRILRTKSITDQIFIKAQRVRSIEEIGSQKIGDNIRDEYIGIVNYSVMALIQLESDVNLTDLELKKEEAEKLYLKYIYMAKELMEKKNHDYGEAWRVMRVSSFTDIILMRILRIKQIGQPRKDNKF